MTKNVVADEIFRQMGGNAFVAMTGSKNFVATENSLRMALVRNKSKANILTITLNANDTYTMEFKKFTPGRFNSKTFTFTEDKETIIKKVEGVYCNMLQMIFTETTGLYTRL